MSRRVDVRRRLSGSASERRGAPSFCWRRELAGKLRLGVEMLWAASACSVVAQGSGSAGNGEGGDGEGRWLCVCEGGRW